MYTFFGKNYEYHGPTDKVANHLISGIHEEFNTHFIDYMLNLCANICSTISRLLDLCA